MNSLVKASVMGALLLAMVVLGTSQAKADPVTFTTSGTFTCSGCFGSGSNSVTFLGGLGNAVVLTFTGVSPTTVNTPSATNFGNIQTGVSGAGASFSGTFTLTITQTSPIPGSDSFSATFSGTFTSSNSGSGLVTFSVTSVTIGGFTYALANNPLLILPPGSNIGNNFILGTVSGSAIPEPASMLLLGTGLVGLGAVVRRKYKNR